MMTVFWECYLVFMVFWLAIVNMLYIIARSVGFSNKKIWEIAVAAWHDMAQEHGWEKQG